MTIDLRSKPGHLIWRAYQLTWHIFSEESADLDITPVQEALLFVLSQNADIDQKTLADMLALDRSTAGGVLDRLQKRGLVNRVENDLDRRARLVSLTKKGKILSEQLKPISSRSAKRILSPLSVAEQNEFKRLLRLITGLADPFDHISTPVPRETKLHGKQILCVGLSGAMGEVIIHRLESEGAEVVQLFPHCAPESSQVLHSELKNVLQKHGRIEFLVNGGNLEKPLESSNDADYPRIQSLVNSRWLVLQALLPHFINQARGGIVNLGLFRTKAESSHDDTAMVVANSAIISYSKQIAENHRQSGIVCNCLLPREQSGAEGAHRTYVEVPAINIALAISYLASDEARSVSASNIVIG